MFEFQTIKENVENVLLKEKGSKFIGFAYPVNSDADAKEKLNHLYEQHPKATHHCYAFRIGINGENYRANDDGEPSGSAGLPIYNQLHFFYSFSLFILWNVVFDTYSVLPNKNKVK